MSISSISLSNVFRLADSGARTVKVSDIPGSAERAHQLLGNLVQETHWQHDRVHMAAARLSTAQANIARVEAIIEDLPATVSAKDRASWARELEGARTGLREANDELGLATSVQAAAPDHILRMQKFIAGHLGISLDEAKSMYTERLNKIA